jgi:FkbM family methyltransferase
MLSRIERKLAEVQRWVDSTHSVVDWPAAIALGLFRTRPAEGRGLSARITRAVLPHLWLRPAALQGLAVRMAPSELSQFVIYEEVFVEGVYDLGRVSFVPDAIVDCGAYEGYFSLLARARFPEAPIVAFEPNARNFAGLTANMGHNRVTIAIRAEAVSITDGTARFSGGGCGGRLSDGQPGEVEITVADLRRVIAELNPERLLLKLDIEGEEARLLPALLPMLPRCCAIFFEWHQGSDQYRSVIDLLASHGFTTELTRENRVDDSTVFIDAFAQRL